MDNFPTALIDITRPVTEDMAIYPGNPAVDLREVQAVDAASGQSALTEIGLGSHTGTHIDAPSHVVAGTGGTGQYDLSQLCGPAVVVDLTERESESVKANAVITADDLLAGDVLASAQRVLCKTRNSALPLTEFADDFVALDESAAEALVAAGVRLVGIDGPSIKKRGVKDKVHQILLQAGMVVLEGLWMPEVAAGSYELWCLPLAVDLDGAPVRAVLSRR